MKIYLVGATTGQCSESREYFVSAYTKESDAKDHVNKQTKYCGKTYYFYREVELHEAFTFTAGEKIQ